MWQKLKCFFGYHYANKVIGRGKKIVSICSHCKNKAPMDVRLFKQAVFNWRVDHSRNGFTGKRIGGKK